MVYTESYIDGLRKACSSLDLSKFKNKSILVTGASGLVGSALCDVLLQANLQYQLEMDLYFCGRNLDRLKKRFAYWCGEGWSAVQYDALKSLDFKFHSDYIFHCASNAHPKAYTESPVETITTNVTGTANILSYARETRASRVLYVSSSEVYGSRESDEPYRESDYCLVDPLVSRSCYPNSKRTCETLCASFRAEYAVDFVIVRPGHIYGPMATAADTRAHAQFAREAAEGRDIVMKSPGDQLRSYMHGTDCAEAMLLVMLNGVSGEAYNVGIPGFSCTIRQLADALAAAGGVSIINDFPSEIERRGYNPMSCSALDCSKLAQLCFRPIYTLGSGAASSVLGLRGSKV